MFESFVANLKSQTNKGFPNPVETIKGKKNRLSETFSSLKSSIILKTNSLSTYLSPELPRSDSLKACSTPNLKSDEIYKTKKYNLSLDKRKCFIKNGKSDCTLNYNDVNPDYEDCNVVDKFIRVINAEDENPQSPVFRVS